MAEIITAEHGADGGHFYKKDGSPAYTVIGKNGKERNTTLRDARTNNLRPSVTEIIKLAAKLGLENWKAEQLLMSALTTSRKDGETEAEYIFRIKADAKEQSEKARERGTLIHSWVQSGFEGKSLTDEACKYFYSAKDELTTVIGVQEWKCELTFATPRYGGKLISNLCGALQFDITNELTELKHPNILSAETFANIFKKTALDFRDRMINLKRQQLSDAMVALQDLEKII